MADYDVRQDEYFGVLVSKGFPEEFVIHLLTARQEFTDEVINRGYPLDTPLSPEQYEECKKLATEIYLNHGITITVTADTDGATTITNDSSKRAISISNFAEGVQP